MGIDRFMSEARALTNFAGNAVATVVVGSWVGELDKEQVDRVLSGQDPFDEAAFAAGEDHHSGGWDKPADPPTDSVEREDPIDVRSNTLAPSTR